MVSKRSVYIVAYDISDAKRLQKGFKVLRDYALGRQKSLFECHLTEAEKASLVARISDVIDDEDRAAILKLDPRSRNRVLGKALPLADDDIFYVG